MGIQYHGTHIYVNISNEKLFIGFKLSWKDYINYTVVEEQ